MANLEQVNEEFNNFMHRVTEVSNIVKKLASGNIKMQEIGTLEADRYLNNKCEILNETINEESVQLKIKNDRTIINKKAFLEEDMNQDTMSQEAFMKEVGRDADRRYQDKLVRKEKADTLKTQATKAFRRGEYEKALTLYDKAIEQIRDSCMLYTNRALTQMKLERYEKAIEDIDKALWLNENSLKARLLLAKLHYINKDFKQFNDAIKEAKDRHESQVSFIEEYIMDVKKDNQNED